MRGQEHVDIDGKQYRISNKMLGAAEKLLPYRLPNLNAIDAVQKNVDMTHEEWLRSMDAADETET